MGLFSELKLAVPWGHIAAKAWGPRNGRPVLCLHAWLDNANSFDRLIPLLPTDFYYVAMDFGGHGLSSHYSPGVWYQQQNFVSEVRRVAAALKWERFSIMSHSFGGLVGGMFSSMFPEMVDKFILLEAYPFLLDIYEMENLLTYKRGRMEHMLQLEEAPKRPSLALSLEDMLQRLLKSNIHVGEECGKILLQRGTTQVATGVVLNRDRRISLLQRLEWIQCKDNGSQEDLEGVAGSFSEEPEYAVNFLSREHCVSFIKKLQAQVLIIKGSEGFNDMKRENDNKKEFRLFMIDTLKSVLKERFQYVEVPGNHYVHMHQPHLLASIISPFLQSKDSLTAQQ